MKVSTEKASRWTCSCIDSFVVEFVETGNSERRLSRARGEFKFRSASAFPAKLTPTARATNNFLSVRRSFFFEIFKRDLVCVEFSLLWLVYLSLLTSESSAITTLQHGKFSADFPSAYPPAEIQTTQVSQEARLRVVIVGAGLSGIATAISAALSGHSVQVIEQAPELAEVGAGLQITPNASRLLKYWKLRDSLWEAAAEPTKLTVHRYSGEVLAHDDAFDKGIHAKYDDAPFVDLHRVDLQQGLYARAQDLGVTFHLGERIERVDFDTTTVHSVAGNQYTGDLIVAADGLWSQCREAFEGRKDEPLPTGDLAYRIVLTSDQVTDPTLKALVENPEVHFWVGPGAHAVGYSVRGGSMYNIVLLVPDNLPPGVSRQAGSVDEMKELFVGWDPILTKFLDYVTTGSIDKWKLMHHGEMEKWVNDKSNLVFIGDSCHPMLPYLAQGANSSLEDGAVLGLLLGHMTDKAQLPRILRLYESLRKSRGEAIVRETFKQRHDFHMVDGEEQKKRDEVFLSQLGKEIKGAFPSRWTCPEVQPWLYGYDAIKEVEKAVAQNPEVFGKQTSRSSCSVL
ncbi:FAD-dependent monooxygenase OpS4 [Penicillium cataractarum]|uniref:FAD-dependent monooxygenase OpS4 n=1 Tax=Penicillium cataractarum TaxID=2100454 RepID=A0A9W9VWK2_9EURO|nr:FAD-dependent monooxygenase OpS4 [Penicillium cataractarum]KAJ5390489.1 FAD-dependent monooxygenase OpS4 [Penicillium cataractarum]